MQGVICTLPAFSTVSKMEPAPPRIKKRPRNMSGATSQKLRFRFFDFGACASAQDDTAKRRAVYLALRGSAHIEHFPRILGMLFAHAYMPFGILLYFCKFRLALAAPYKLML